MVSNEDINKQIALKRNIQYTDVERDDFETQHPLKVLERNIFSILFQ